MSYMKEFFLILFLFLLSLLYNGQSNGVKFLLLELSYLDSDGIIMVVFDETVPKTRSQLVNELEIPEVTVTPYIWVEPEESLTETDSLPSVSIEQYEARTLSSDSSLALSRAMTDSEIDYERYRRLKSRSFSDPWLEMRAALDAFPPGYLDSLTSFQTISSEVTESPPTQPSASRQRYNEELRLKMERFFEEECRVFTPDDPGLLALDEALHELNLKDSELESHD